MKTHGFVAPMDKVAHHLPPRLLDEVFHREGCKQSRRRKQSQGFLWTPLVVAERQHFSRSSLGTWTGDLRRSYLSRIAPRCGFDVLKNLLVQAQFGH